MRRQSIRRWHWTIGAAAICGSLLLTGCTTAGTPKPKHRVAANTTPTHTDTQVTHLAATPATDTTTPAKASTARDLRAPGVELFPGTGAFLASHRHAATHIDGQGDITLNFVNADIKDVAKTILGDYLKLNYEIAGNAHGTVTIQTSRPLGRTQVLPVLEQTLRLNRFALVKANGIYKVMPISAARQTDKPVSVASATEMQSEGYGTEIVPLHYVGATQMSKIIGTLAPGQGIVHADRARNLLIIEGTQSERQTLLDNVRLFDTDWLSGMSFALYTPAYTDAAEMTKELYQVLGGISGPISEVVKLIPIKRLNAILAISPQPRYLGQIKTWIARLDRPGQGSDRHIFVYHVQNGRAKDLAATLVKVLGVSGSGAGGDATVADDQAALSPERSAIGDGHQPAPAATVMLPQAQRAGVNVSGLGAVRITADETNNALVILATPPQFGTIRNALQQLDTAPKEVFLEAAITEVTLTKDLKYGVQYFFQPGSKHSITLSNTKSGSISAAFPGFSYMFTQGNDIKVILDALSNLTHVDVVSSPQILVLNNQTATLQVGDQVPIVTQQAVSTVTTGAPLVNSVQYQNTGVILKVTPRVNRGGVVMMDITQEVSNVTNTTSSNINSPTIEQRKITSSVAVEDGETIALGGLISNTTTRSKSGIPYLQRIPILGNLFRDTGDNKTRTELMVLITPHVVDNENKARAITQELRRELPALEPLLSHRK